MSSISISGNSEASHSTFSSFSSLEKIFDAFGLTLSQFFADGEALLALTPGQRGMLEKWLRLSPAQQRALVSVMDSMLEE